MIAAKPHALTTAVPAAAGTLHGAAALDLGHLTDDRSNGTRGSRHNHGLARFRLTDLRDADPGSNAWHPHRAKIDSRRNRSRVDLGQADPR